MGILNEKDSLMYRQNNLPISRYLVAENFTQFFFTWKVALFERTRKSVEQLAVRERQLYLALFVGILIVMLTGIIILARAVIHETEVSQMKSEFVSNVTHELKTPLSLIRMFGETLESGEEPIMINIDKDAISQAFLNLLSNAVKYSEERKYIGVDIRMKKNSAMISVTDHGVGIARGELKKVFDKFYRVPNNMVKQPRGSGLGLTLTMHIVEAHNGTIEVNSEPGRVSTFTIRLPLS